MAIAIPRAAASHRAYQILHFAFVIAPLLAGIDKFTNYLTNWAQYLWPPLTRIMPAHTFMMVVGCIEIVAALIVLFKPKVGAWIVMAWLWGIVVNLLLLRGFDDVALRDFGLSLGAMALGFLSVDHEGHGMAAHRGTPAASPS